MKKPTQTSSYARVRQTAATARRAKTLRALIARLREGEMHDWEIQEFLGFSPSGSRKYIAELNRAEAIIVLRRVPKANSLLGSPVYGIALEEEKIQNFLDLLELPGGAAPIARHVAPRHAAVASGPSRNFHILADDGSAGVRVPSLKVPEHTELLATFFGLKAKA
jgi:hypothetical protein